MALFESYERRIDQINSVLNSYGCVMRTIPFVPIMSVYAL